MSKFFILIFIGVHFFASAQEYPVETIVQKGHTDLIRTMKFSRDGRFIVTGSEDQSVKLWDLKSGREIRTFKGHQGPVLAVDIHLEDGLIISAGSTSVGSEIIVWDIFTGERKKAVKGGQPFNLFTGEMEWAFEITSLALAQDGKTLFWSEDNHDVQVGKITRSRGNEKLDTDWHPISLQISPDGHYIAAGGQALNTSISGSSNEVKIWTVDDLRYYKTLATKNNNINGIKYSKDGKRIAVLSTKEINVGEQSDPFIQQLQVSYNNVFTVYDFESGKELFEIDTRGDEVNDFAFSPDGKFIALPTNPLDLDSDLLNQKESILVFEIESNTRPDTIETDESQITTLDFSPDGRLLIGSGNKINYWNTSTWQSVRRINSPSRINDLWINSNNLICTKEFENDQVTFNLSLNSRDFQENSFPKYSYAQFFEQGLKVARAEGSSIYVYDIASNNLLETLIDSIPGWSKITQFEFNDDYIICINDQEEEIFVKSRTNTKTNFLKGYRDEILSMALHPTKNLLASGSSGNRIFLWDLSSMKNIGTLLGHNADILDLEFNHDGTLLASGSGDRNVRLWDVEKQSRKELFMGHESDVQCLAFNEEGTRLASGSGDPVFGGRSEVIIWDIKRGKEVRSFESNEGYIKKILFDKDKLYTIGNDPVIYAFDASSGDQLYAYIPLDKGNYIIFTQENYYSSTKLQQPVVHFVKGLEIYSFDNFDLKFNRPDIILKKIGSKNQNLIDAFYKVYSRRLEKAGFSESEFEDDFHLPDIIIIGKENIPLHTEDKFLQLMVEASDKKYLLEKLVVKVNNVPLFGSGGLDLSNNREAKRNIKIELAPGRNKIQVSCLNQNGSESHRETIEVFSSQNQGTNLHLVVLGVSEYADPAMNLNFAAKDGRDVVKLFSQNQKIYSHIFVDTLFNEKAIKSNFLDVKKSLLQSGVNDIVIVFLAGHGVLDRNFDFVFASHDINPADPLANGITFNDIEFLVDSIPARRKLVLIDACHSGEVDKEEIKEVTLEVLKQQDVRGDVTSQTFEKMQMNVFEHYGINNTTVEMIEELFLDINNQSGSIVISAAAGNSYALESQEWNNGVFTYCLINGLKNMEADEDKDHRVNIGEMRAYVGQNVFTLTNGKQKPTSRNENFEFDFTIWE